MADCVTVKLLEVFTALKKQGVFQMETIRGVAISVDDDTEWGDTGKMGWS